jgi:hypothetical protein
MHHNYKFAISIAILISVAGYLFKQVAQEIQHTKERHNQTSITNE